MSAVEDTAVSDRVPPDGGIPPTDILVAGLPGALLRWTCDLLADAMARPHEAVAHLSIGGVEQWTPPDPTAAPIARLFFGDFISEDWAAPLRAGRIPAVFVVDESTRSWHYLCQTEQESGEAVRNLVAIATSLGDLAGHDRILTLPRAAWNYPMAVATRILTHVGLPPKHRPAPWLRWSARVVRHPGQSPCCSGYHLMRDI